MSLRRLLADVPKGKRQSVSPEDGVRRSARSFPQLGSLQSLDPALEEMMTLGSNTLKQCPTVAEII